MVVKDLATKKQVTVKVTPDAQMKRLPEGMAQMLAARLKGGANGGAMHAPQGAPGGAPAAGGPPAGGAPPAGMPPAGGVPPPGAPQRASGGGQGSRMGNGNGDPQQMLSRAPDIQLSDLKKGDAVMLVSTEGASDVSAVTLLAGVEPLLESPAASQNLLSNWSMGGGGGAEGAGGPQ